MAKEINVADEIDKMVTKFADQLTPIQKKAYDKVQLLLKELKLDAEGNIKPTVSNLSIIQDVQEELNSIVRNPAFQKNVAEVNQTLKDVNDLQQDFFQNTVDPNIVTPPLLDATRKDAFNTTAETLTGAGMQENVVNSVVDIVRTGINEGQSFTTMNDALKKAMLGDEETDGKLVSYSKQIVSDTLHTQARAYNAKISDDFDLVWYHYTGPLKDTSRDWCIALEAKEWIHESELGQICRGYIDGDKVSLAGLMPDTNADNVVYRCGGYNCQHHMVAVPASRVPSSIRRNFEDDTEPDDEEIADSRPRH